MMLKNHILKNPLRARRFVPQTVAIAAVVVVLQGCAERKPHAYPWATAIAVRPHKPQPAPGYQPPAADESAPDLRLDFPPPPSRLAAMRSPSRPRVTPQPPAEVGAPAKPEALSFAPQLSEQEIAAARQQTNDSKSMAHKNLAAAKDRQLNATQADLASKVRSFLAESDDAVKTGDWNRARNLAKKAQVLSEELANSL